VLSKPVRIPGGPAVRAADGEVAKTLERSEEEEEEEVVVVVVVVVVAVEEEEEEGFLWWGR